MLIKGTSDETFQSVLVHLWTLKESIIGSDFSSKNGPIMSSTRSERQRRSHYRAFFDRKNAENSQPIMDLVILLWQKPYIYIYSINPNYHVTINPLMAGFFIYSIAPLKELNQDMVPI